MRVGWFCRKEVGHRTMSLTRTERLLLYGPLGGLLSIFLVIPGVLGLLATLSNYGPIQAELGWVGLRNFEAILADRTFGAALRNTAIFTLCAVPLELAIGFA